jgi:DNA (cytosine-5)-methyltransferase 1
MAKNVLRAIDLYSGVGGWSLGLKMAGIKLVASYDRCNAANDTNTRNNRHVAQTVDIRSLRLHDLPTNIDVVVGSPPCTEFSFSNRGGGGDIAEGLEDIIRFLTIVDYLKPRFWVMENVPRVKEIIVCERKRRGRLQKFAHLEMSTSIVNMEGFGLPQRRRRCLAGNLDFSLLSTYAANTRQCTLGDVVKALAKNPVSDPLYGRKVKKSEVTDHIVEDFLNPEEERINRAGKLLHPIYNRMSFPDRLDRSVRTITATCTRVSRESVVIEDLNCIGRVRRLTIRERACLQGFPTQFQFYGTSYKKKLQMVGNAMPPSFAYYVAQAIKGTSAARVPLLPSAINNFRPPRTVATEAFPDTPGTRYPLTRRFRFAIPTLRLKSGVRFELNNSFAHGQVNWQVAFYFGTSKSIQRLPLDSLLYKMLVRKLPKKPADAVLDELEELSVFLRGADIKRLQNVWAHRGPGATRPFTLLDRLSETGGAIAKLLAPHEAATRAAILEAINAHHANKVTQLKGVGKLLKHSALILAGLLVGALANGELYRHIPPLRQEIRRRAAN